MNIFSIETVKDSGESLFLVVNMPKDKIKPFLATDNFKQILSQKDVKPTGQIYIADSINDKSVYYWSGEPAKNSSIFTNFTQFDSLAELYFAHKERLDSLEKEMKVILKNEPEHKLQGSEYGAYDNYTESTSLSYSQLYDTLKQSLLKKFGQAGQELIDQMKKEEIKMQEPHKGSSKVFKVFRLGVRDEFAKIWKGQ